MKTNIKKVTSIIVSVLLWVIIAVTAVFVFMSLSAKQNNGVPKLFGYSPLVVVSNSMNSTRADDFKAGDIVVIGPVDTSKLKVNDIVTFPDFINGKESMNTHRIVKIQTVNGATKITTQGDNNPTPDADLKAPSDIIGIYKFQIKGAGDVMSFLSGKWGFLFCLVLPLFLFFIWRLIKLVMAVVAFKKADLEEKANPANAAAGTIDSKDIDKKE